VLLVLAESEGGIGRHVATLARDLPERGVAVTVCGPGRTLEALGDLAPARVVAAPVGRLAPHRSIAARRRLRELAASCDVVHAHGLRAGAAAIATGSDRPVAVTWHNAVGVTGVRRLAHGALARYVARRADLTLAASDDLGEAARRAGARQVQSTFVVAPPLPPPRTDRMAVRRELGAGDRPLVLAVGRLTTQKRFDVVVDAAAGWADEPAAPLVVIAGEGPDRAALAARIAATGAPVSLLGSRDDIADLLAAADAMVITSSWEAQALVAQEALRAGVPLVTTAVGGLPGLVGPAAIRVTVGDATAVRQGIESILHDAELRERLVSLGAARVAGWPDQPAMLDELVRTYQGLRRTESPPGG
jgi:glycosyltransferase involved in cell wall biosynthesis